MRWTVVTVDELRLSIVSQIVPVTHLGVNIYDKVFLPFAGH